MLIASFSALRKKGILCKLHIFVSYYKKYFILHMVGYLIKYEDLFLI